MIRGRGAVAPDPASTLKDVRSGTPAQRQAANVKELDLAEKLLNAGSYETARSIIENAISSQPENARAHLLYLRWLLLSSDVAEPGFLASPYERSGSELTVSWQQAAKNVAALVPEWREETAETIFQSLVAVSEKALDRDRGLIGGPVSLKNNSTGMSYFSNGFETSMLNVAWTGLELSPEAARRHRRAILQLMERAIGKGLVTSAAMLGNLLGDLEQEDPKGDRDLQRACEGFERALAAYTADSHDWIAYTLAIINDGIFEPELAGALVDEASSPCRKLDTALSSRGYSLRVAPWGQLDYVQWKLGSLVKTP